MCRPRSISRGIGQVVAEIEVGSFGAAFHGLPLDTLVHCNASRRQIFNDARAKAGLCCRPQCFAMRDGVSRECPISPSMFPTAAARSRRTELTVTVRRGMLKR